MEIVRLEASCVKIWQEKGLDQTLAVPCVASQIHAGACLAMGFETLDGPQMGWSPSDFLYIVTVTNLSYLA